MMKLLQQLFDQFVAFAGRTTTHLELHCNYPDNYYGDRHCVPCEKEQA